MQWAAACEARGVGRRKHATRNSIFVCERTICLRFRGASVGALAFQERTRRPPVIVRLWAVLACLGVELRRAPRMRALFVVLVLTWHFLLLSVRVVCGSVRQRR